MNGVRIIIEFGLIKNTRDIIPYLKRIECIVEFTEVVVGTRIQNPFVVLLETMNLELDIRTKSTGTTI